MNAIPTTRILLSEAASRHLEGTGKKFFCVCGMEPSGEHAGRFVIHLRPWPDHLAAEARGVLTGTHRTVKIETELFTS